MDEDVPLAPTSSDSAEKGGALLVAEYPGVPASIQGAYNEYYAFVGFSPNKSEAVLAYMTSFNLTQTQNIISSGYGNVHPGAFNMTSSGFRGTKWIMTTWGVRCALYPPGRVCELLPVRYGGREPAVGDRGCSISG